METHLKILLFLTLLKSITDCNLLFDDKTSWNYDDLISNPRSDRRISLSENNDISFTMPGRKCKSNFRILNGMYRIRERGTFVRFSCSYGYILFGSSIALCVKGTWSHQPPVCVRGGGCRKLNNPRNGFSRSLYGGGVAGFQCGSGFSLIGASILTCNSRIWNGTEPICIPIEDSTVLTETIVQDQNEDNEEVTDATQIEPEPEKIDIQMEAGIKIFENSTSIGISTSSPLPLPTPSSTSTVTPKTSNISTSADLLNFTSIIASVLNASTETWTVSPTTIIPLTETSRGGESTEEGRDSVASTLNPPENTAKITQISSTTETVTSNSNRKSISNTTITDITPILETTKQIENTTGEIKSVTNSMSTFATITSTPTSTSTLSQKFSSYTLTTKTSVTNPSVIKTKIVTYKMTLPTVKITTTTTTTTKTPKLLSTSAPTNQTNLAPVSKKTTLKSTEIPKIASKPGNFPTTSKSKSTILISTETTTMVKNVIIPASTSTTTIKNSTDADQYQTIDEGSAITEPYNENSIDFDEITPVTVLKSKSLYKYAERHTLYEILLYTFYIVISITFLSFFIIILIRLWRKNKGIARARSYDLDGRILRSHDGNEEFLWMQSHRETESDL